VSSDKAATALKKIEGTLRQIATTQVNAARGKSWADAAANLKAAEDADPDYVEIYRLRTQIAAATGTTGQLQDSLKELARRNLIDIEYLAALPGLDARFALPGFEQFLVDVMGANQTATLKQSASPAGRIAFVSNLAQQGKITFFLGRKQDGNSNSYKVWTRRNVSGVRLTGQCTVAVGLGGSLGNSPDLAAYNPSTLTLDLLQMRGAPVFNNTAIELGRTMKDWEMTAFGVPDGGTLARQVSDAINYAYSACPRPVGKKR